MILQQHTDMKVQYSQVKELSYKLHRP